MGSGFTALRPERLAVTPPQLLTGFTGWLEGGFVGRWRLAGLATPFPGTCLPQAAVGPSWQAVGACGREKMESLPTASQPGR